MDISLSNISQVGEETLKALAALKESQEKCFFQNIVKSKFAHEEKIVVASDSSLNDTDAKAILTKAIYIKMCWTNLEFENNRDSKMLAINTSQSNDIRLKRLGYLASCVLVDYFDPLNILSVNTIQRDLKSNDISRISLALLAAPQLVPTDAVLSVLPLVEKRCYHSDTKVKCRALNCFVALTITSQNDEEKLSEILLTAACDRSFRVSAVALKFVEYVMCQKPTLFKESDKLSEILIHVLKQILSKKIPQHAEYAGLAAPQSQIIILKIMALLLSDVGSNKCINLANRFFPLVKDTMERCEVDSRCVLRFQRQIIACFTSEDSSISQLGIEVLALTANPKNAKAILAKVVEIFKAIDYQKSTYKELLVAIILKLSTLVIGEDFWFLEAMIYLMKIGGAQFMQKKNINEIVEVIITYKERYETNPTVVVDKILTFLKTELANEQLDSSLHYYFVFLVLMKLNQSSHCIFSGDLILDPLLECISSKENFHLLKKRDAMCSFLTLILNSIDGVSLTDTSKSKLQTLIISLENETILSQQILIQNIKKKIEKTDSSSRSNVDLASLLNLSILNKIASQAFEKMDIYIPKNEREKLKKEKNMDLTKDDHVDSRLLECSDSWNKDGYVGTASKNKGKKSDKVLADDHLAAILFKGIDLEEKSTSSHDYKDKIEQFDAEKDHCFQISEDYVNLKNDVQIEFDNDDFNQNVSDDSLD